MTVVPATERGRIVTDHSCQCTATSRTTKSTENNAPFVYAFTCEKRVELFRVKIGICQSCVVRGVLS